MIRYYGSSLWIHFYYYYLNSPVIKLLSADWSAVRKRLRTTALKYIINILSLVVFQQLDQNLNLTHQNFYVE